MQENVLIPEEEKCKYKTNQEIVDELLENKLIDDCVFFSVPEAAVHPGRKVEATMKDFLLIAVTPDYLYIWNLFESNWERTCEWRKVNKTAIRYGEKEWELMAHLSLRDAHKIKRYLS